MRATWSRRSEQEPEDAKPPKGLAAKVLELMLVVVVALGLALVIQWLLVKPYRIPSRSMVPTLRVGQRVLVNRLGNRFGDPSIGDILIFHPPVGAEHNDVHCDPETRIDENCAKAIDREDTKTNFIKRVVAGPGDEIFIRDGHVYRKGKGENTFKRESDGYIAPCDPGQGCDFPTPILIPPGHWFMMGDNRGQSEDSRYWGSIPRSWIIGEAVFTYWPPDRIGFL